MKKAAVPPSKPKRPWIYLLPILGILWVWLSSLSFVPVPWPDDSAFYFPAKDLFAWPPRWVMIPQAPFEPTYRIWNFNTMPLYPILLGIAQILGVTGTHALKFLPLGGWLLSILLVLRALRNAKASPLLLAAAALVFTFDPVLRWSSVLLRPESLIGAMGIFILFGFRFGWPPALRERKYFHPAALALGIAAYLHFNAIHLVPLVVALYLPDYRKILKIGALTALGLLPWLGTILLHPDLFVAQMALQFGRLSGYVNPWLSSWPEFMKALLEDMGSPEPWSREVQAAALLGAAATPFLAVATAALARLRADRERAALFGGAAWFMAALYLWHTKAEVWFTHYFHLAFWAWMILVLHAFRDLPGRVGKVLRSAVTLPILVGLMFLYGQIDQTIRLKSSASWHWRTYDAWIDCIDGFLTTEYEKRGKPDGFRVWDPTFPDITIALAQRHPTWEFTRTNDFHTRNDLAVAHGHAVEAMVVTEIFRQDDLDFTGAQSERPLNRSVWMDWESYFLNRLARDPGFKPRRFLCQRGRWDAFIYLNP